VGYEAVTQANNRKVTQPSIKISEGPTVFQRKGIGYHLSVLNWTSNELDAFLREKIIGH